MSKRNSTNDSNSRLVYSTATGRIKEDKTPQSNAIKKGDGIIRIRRETKGRKGKGVSIIDGLLQNDDQLKKTAKKLKQLCGTGGAVKNGVIEIQGDHRDTLKVELEKQGFTVKLAGG